MDLSRGICILCTNTKIIVPPQAEDTTSLIKDVLAGQIDQEKFDEINSSLKVCPMCLHDLITVANLKSNIKKRFSEDPDNCLLCYTEKNVVFITEWTNFDNILENIKTEKRPSRCSACLNCIKCLDLLERIKMNFFRKYPRLELSDLSKGGEFKKSVHMVKNNRENYRKLQRNEAFEYLPRSTKKNVNNLKAALKHLRPLKNTQFNTDQFKNDKKLLKQVAFVKLSISNLSTNDYKLEDRSRISEKSKRSINLSDTDSLRDSPSPKQSFFKIKLKINPNKTKSTRVAHGKVTKPKTYQNKLMSGHKKELIVKIIKMNLDKVVDLDRNCQKSMEIRTPTKASRKMMPGDSVTSSKKRKSVTFADVLNTEIPDGSSRKDNDDATPLKSLLKKSVVLGSDLLKQGDEATNDDSNNDNNKAKRETEPDPDSDEEFEIAKGFVDEILKNNDDIFNSLKTSKNTEVIPAKVKNNRSSWSIDSNSTDSENETHDLGGKDTESNKLVEQENTENLLEVKKSKRSEIIEVNNSDSENEESKAESIEEKSYQNEEHVGDKETKYNTKTEENDVIKVVEDENKLDSSNKSKDNGEVIIDDSQIIRKSSEKNNKSKLKNKGDKKKNSHNYKKSEGKKINQKHKKRRGSNSISDSDPEENTLKIDSNKKDLSGNEVLSTENSNNAKSDQEGEISLQDKQNKNKNGTSSETSTENQEVTLEEFKKLRKSDLGEDSISEENNKTNGIVIPDEDSSSETLIHNKEIIDDQDSEKVVEGCSSEIIINKNQDCERISEDTSEDIVDSDISNNKRKDGNNLTDDKQGVDIGSESGKSSKRPSSNLKCSSKKRRKSTVEREEEDDEDLKNSRDDEECEGPETKREKVSGIDDLSKTDLEKNIKASKTKKEDMSLGVPQKRKEVDTVDNKIDELVAKFTNPSIPNLNNDNVSDSQNAGASGKDQGSDSEVSSGGPDEAVGKDTNVKKAILEEMTKRFDKNVTNIVENNSESAITINSDAPDNVTLKGLDLDNILENIVDSC